VYAVVFEKDEQVLPDRPVGANVLEMVACLVICEEGVG